MLLMHFTLSEIEGMVLEIQAKHQDEDTTVEQNRVALGEGGHYDVDIYDGKSEKFAGYVTSIAATDELDADVS